MTSPTLASSIITTCSRVTRFVRHQSGGSSTTATWRALAIFHEHGPLRVSDFAELDGLSQPSATAMVKRLVAQGILERSPDPDDARATRLTLTEAGQDVLAQRRDRASEIMQPLLTELNAKERETVAEAIMLLTRALDASTPQIASPNPERTAR